MISNIRQKWQCGILSFFQVFPIVFFLSSLYLISAQANQTITTGFSPSGHAVDVVERAINQAKESIDVAAYTFTSHRIADYLIAAKQRGVIVRVVLDAKAHKRHYPAIDDLLAADIPIRTNSHYAIMHNKYLIIDNKTVETGSFNFTASAEKRNAENVVVIRNNKTLAHKYFENWEQLWQEGESYQ